MDDLGNPGIIHNYKNCVKNLHTGVFILKMQVPMIKLNWYHHFLELQREMWLVLCGRIHSSFEHQKQYYIIYLH